MYPVVIEEEIIIFNPFEAIVEVVLSNNFIFDVAFVVLFIEEI